MQRLCYDPASRTLDRAARHLQCEHLLQVGRRVGSLFLADLHRPRVAHQEFGLTIALRSFNTWKAVGGNPAGTSRRRPQRRWGPKANAAHGDGTMMTCRGGAFPAWLPTAVVLGVVFLAVYGWTGQARSEPSSGASDKAQEVINRFHYAIAHAKKLKEVGKNEMFPLINCPEEFSLGYRTTPGQKVPEFAGNTCEPWIARYAVVVLDKLLDPDMKGLEWSTGSGTMWLLTRLHSLVSIEHHASWVRRVQQTLERIFPASYIKRWDLHVVEAKDFKTKALEEDYDNFKEYVDADFLPHEPTYDFVSVDGRARIHCMKRALPLVKPEGGVFMLDNSDREAYVEGYDFVPSHWLKFEDSVNTGERTTIWVTCLPGKCGSTTKRKAASGGGKKKGKKTSTA